MSDARPIHVYVSSRHLGMFRRGDFYQFAETSGWCQDPDHEHGAEYLAALLWVCARAGIPVDAPASAIAKAARVPLLRGRYRRVIDALNDHLDVRFDQRYRERMTAAAEKLFADDSCEVLRRDRHQYNLRHRYLSVHRVEELKWFIREHGRYPLESPQRGGPEHRLARWVQKQRQNAQSAWQAVLDREVPGWRFPASEGLWARTYREAAAFTQHHGRLPHRASRNPDEARLGRWVHNQLRQQRTAVKCWTPERAAAMAELDPARFEALAEAA